MKERGTTPSEVTRAILEGEKIPAKEGRLGFRYNFEFHSWWAGKRYTVKQVVPIVVRENGSFVVVTVYVFYF